ncbi:MarR family transcriptional regulator [Novosphingobium sp. M1R2S20]|uniref:MarR family transcriptional regulator n=1 Tax=Novosphingobium rhizovicinum TaxID=3228928 RepID=A0ABV3RCK7_9SPHN
MAVAEHVMRNRAKAMRLIGIANDLLAMARELEMTTHADPSGTFSRTDGSSAPQPGNHDHPIWVELARQTYDDRRRRSKIFQTDELFGEPAWDILLDLFIAAKERRRVSVTSACIGSAVPSTTALRWISILEREGLLTREADPGDARRVYVRLSPKGYEAMLEYFSASSRSVVLLDDCAPEAARRR